MPTDDICEIDLAAYIDGELDTERTCKVERYLAARPAEAAKIMADLASRDALRLIAQRRGLSKPALGMRPWRRKRGARLGRPARVAAACVALALAAVVAFNVSEQSVAAVPAYLDDALMSHRVTMLRSRMPSQLEAPLFDAGDLMRETRIRVPELPKGWQVLDAQLFPSDEGPALQLLVRTHKQGALSIFAVHGASTAPTEPSAVRREGQSIAFWRKGDVSYAIIGDGTPEEIDRIADDLEDSDLG